MISLYCCDILSVMLHFLDNVPFTRFSHGLGFIQVLFMVLIGHYLKSFNGIKSLVAGHE